MKIRKVIGVVFLIFIVGAFLFNHFNSGPSTLHFENQYVSFDYPSDWTINDLSGQNMNITGAPNAHYSLSMNITGPNGVSGGLQSTTVEAMQIDNYQHTSYVINGYNVTQFIVPWGYDYFIQTKNNIYELMFVLSDVNDGNQWNNTENISEGIINSIHFK